MAEFIQHTEYHYQYRGKVIVNYYPTKRTAYISKTNNGIPCSSSELASKWADNPELIPVKCIAKAKRKNNNKTLRHKLFYDRGINKCYCCEKTMTFEETTLEHIIPLAKGGSNNIDNLSLSHYECNNEKGNNY